MYCIKLSFINSLVYGQIRLILQSLIRICLNCVVRLGIHFNKQTFSELNLNDDFGTVDKTSVSVDQYTSAVV